MKKNILLVIVSLLLFKVNAQLKIGANPKSISNNANFHVESADGNNFVISRDSNKVGIGTTEPSNLLHVKSTLNPLRLEGLNRGDSTENVLMVNDSGIVRKVSSINYSAAYEPWYNMSANLGATSNTQNIYQMGRVGIMTNSPAYPLEVMGTNSLDAFAIGNTSLGSSFRTKISAQGSGSNDRWMKFNSDWNSTTNGTRAFGFFRGANEYLTILDNGNVGIGINNPTSNLQINSPNANTLVRMGFTFTGVDRVFDIGISGAANQGLAPVMQNDAWIRAGGSTNSNNQNLFIGTGNTGNTASGRLGFVTNNSERMSIIQNGNVGIGTTNPLHELHIANTGPNITSWDKSLLHLQNGDIHYTISLANNFNNANWGSGAADYLANGVNNAMVINLGGMGQYIFGDHVGPWSTGAYDLGNSYARWNNIYLTNSPNVSSDLRLKSNIKPLDLGLNEILKLQPKFYKKHNDFEKKSEGHEEYGFIAQELKKVLPLVVSGNENDINPLGVKYEQIIPVLTKAIQELNQKIIEKDLEIIELKNMILQIRNDIQNINSRK